MSLAFLSFTVFLSETKIMYGWGTLRLSYFLKIFSYLSMKESEPVASSVSLPTSGLRQRELCEHFNWEYRDIARAAKQAGVTTHAYLMQKTGWILRDELWYPPSPVSPSDDSSTCDH